VNCAAISRRSNSSINEKRRPTADRDASTKRLQHFTCWAESRRGRKIEPVFAAIRSANTQSILLPPEPLILLNREAIAGFAQTHLLPLAGTSRALPASGLMAFGPARDEYSQLAARYVDCLLRRQARRSTR